MAASDYALIDDVTWQPRPSYWVALLWRKMMATTVLKSDSNQANLHLYAHCLRDQQGGVALIAVNLNRSESRQLRMPVPSRRYSLTANVLEGGVVKLNGKDLTLASNEQLPELVGEATQRGAISLAPASVTFLEVPQAKNPACTAR